MVYNTMQKLMVKFFHLPNIVDTIWHTDVPLPLSFPTPCSVGHLTTHYLDFQSIPRRSFFELLAHFSASNEMEREKLLEFITPEGQVGYYQVIFISYFFVCHKSNRSNSSCITLLS